MPAFMAYGYCTPLVQCTCCYPLFCMHRGCWFSLYARKTHTHDNVLNRQEMVLIGMLLIASVPATRMLVG